MMRITGWVMIAVLVFIALVTFGSEAQVIDESSDPVLAVIQVYVAGAFWAMIVIGIGIAVYIMKRRRPTPNETATFERDVELARELDRR